MIKLFWLNIQRILINILKMLTFKNSDMFAEFENDKNAVIINCVCGDLNEICGLPGEFNKRYFTNMRATCELTANGYGSHPYIGCPIFVGRIVNLVVKDHKDEKTKYQYVEAGLRFLNDELTRRGYNKVIMPAICCGHNGLDKNTIIAMVKAYLKDKEVIMFV